MISMFIKLLKNTEEYFISLHRVFFLLYIKQVGAVLLNSNFLLYNLFPVINNYADFLRHRKDCIFQRCPIDITNLVFY